MISSVALKALPRAGILVGFGLLSQHSPGSPAFGPLPGTQPGLCGAPGGVERQRGYSADAPQAHR